MGHSAEAQRYYARQRLVGVPLAASAAPEVPQTPQPNYRYLVRESSRDYGACVNNEKKQEVITCLRSDGVVVANSLCTPPTAPCGTKCEPLSPNAWVGNPGTVLSTSRVGSAADAYSWCNANKPSEYFGSCFWDGRDGTVQLSSATLMGFDNAKLHASHCREF